MLNMKNRVRATHGTSSKNLFSRSVQRWPFPEMLILFEGRRNKSHPPRPSTIAGVASAKQKQGAASAKRSLGLLQPKPLAGGIFSFMHCTAPGETEGCYEWERRRRGVPVTLYPKPCLSLPSSLVSWTFSARYKTKAKQTQGSCGDAVIPIVNTIFNSTFTMIKQMELKVTFMSVCHWFTYRISVNFVDKALFLLV